MFAWLGENLGTILVTLALAGLLAWIVWGLRKEKKRGSHAPCGGACSHCAMCEACQQTRSRS